MLKESYMGSKNVDQTFTEMLRSLNLEAIYKILVNKEGNTQEVDPDLQWGHRFYSFRELTLSFYLFTPQIFH